MRNLFLFGLLLLFASSCSKSEYPTVGSSINKIEQNSNVSAIEYYDLIESAIFATNSNSKDELLNLQESKNPLVSKLNNMTIIGEDGSKISFFDMPVNEQKEFLAQWKKIEADDMSIKLSNMQNLENIIKEKNVIVRSVLEEEAVVTKNNELYISNKKSFFDKIDSRMSNLYKSEKKPIYGDNQTKATNVFEDSISLSTLTIALESYSKRGDFMLALPRYNQPWVYLNTGDDRFMVGHAAIIDKLVNRTWNNSDHFTIGAQGEGITTEPLHYWRTNCYIMGLQEVKWQWVKRGILWKLEKKIVPIENTDKFADYSHKYIGCEYVKWYEFLFAKWVAPARFTCTSLVWYCAQETYGIDVSAWWSALVAPTDLYLSDFTYIKKAIEE